MLGDCGPQIVCQMLSEGLDSGLRGVVRRISRRVGDPLLAAGQNDGRGRAAVFLHDWQKCRNSIDNAKHIDMHRLLEVGGIGPVRQACLRLGPSSGVQHEQVDGGEGGGDFR